MLSERILAALVHWINGDPSAAWNEGFCIESAVITDGRIKVELSQDSSDTHVFAMFALMEISLPAKIRQNSASSAKPGPSPLS